MLAYSRVGALNCALGDPRPLRKNSTHRHALRSAAALMPAATMISVEKNVEDEDEGAAIASIVVGGWVVVVDVLVG